MSNPCCRRCGKRFASDPGSTSRCVMRRRFAKSSTMARDLFVLADRNSARAGTHALAHRRLPHASSNPTRLHRPGHRLRDAGPRRSRRRRRGAARAVCRRTIVRFGRRVLRAFLYGGFNADERGRIAFDGMLISSAGAGRGSFDQRYAMTGEAGTSVGSDLRPTDVFPFSDGDETTRSRTSTAVCLGEPIRRTRFQRSKRR